MLASLSTSHLALKRPANINTPRLSQSRVAPQALFGGGNKEGGGGGMGGFMENLKKAQAMIQVEAAKMQEELAVTDIEGFSSDETVRAVFSGTQEPKTIDITQAAIDQGPEKLSALVAEAMKDAHSNSVAEMKTKLGALAQKMGVPGGGMPGM